MSANYVLPFSARGFATNKESSRCEASGVVRHGSPDSPPVPPAPATIPHDQFASKDAPEKDLFHPTLFLDMHKIYNID